MDAMSERCLLILVNLLAPVNPLSSAAGYCGKLLSTLIGQFSASILFRSGIVPDYAIAALNRPDL